MEIMAINHDIEVGETKLILNALHKLASSMTFALMKSCCLYALRHK